ncbi:TPA: hypothetical protein ACS78C_000293 [Providencia alcalifaciens]
MEPKDYTYYKIQGEIVNQLDTEFNNIKTKRQQVIEDALAKVGAISAIFSNSWGENGSLIRAFAFAKDKSFNFPIKVIAENNETIALRAKANTIDGRAFNKLLEQAKETANLKLKNLPTYKDFLINKFNVQNCTIGSEISSKGMRLISTLTGKAAKVTDTVLFAIPINKENSDKIKIPECFEKISYGTFYDLVNP